MSAPVRLLILLGLLASTGCGPAVDLTKGLQILDVTTGWYDAGIVNGQNKLVPSIRFRLKNVSDQKLPMLQVNAIFRRVAEKDELGTALITAAGSNGLAPGATTPTLMLKSDHGYTGTEPRLDMLSNSHFIDAKAELTAKYGSTEWKRIGEYLIVRQLIAP